LIMSLLDDRSSSGDEQNRRDPFRHGLAMIYEHCEHFTP
jgi:hypothetical protein